MTQNNIPVADFPDYVKQMHEDMNHKFHMEYNMVSYIYICNKYAIRLLLFVVTGKSASASK